MQAKVLTFGYQADPFFTMENKDVLVIKPTFEKRLPSAVSPLFFMVFIENVLGYQQTGEIGDTIFYKRARSFGT